MLCWKILVTRGNLGVTQIIWNGLGDVYISEMLINNACRVKSPQLFGEIISLDPPLSLFIPPLVSQPPRLKMGIYPRTFLHQYLGFLNYPTTPSPLSKMYWDNFYMLNIAWVTCTTVFKLGGGGSTKNIFFSL